MKELIERVAKEANWTFDTGCLCWLPRKGSVMFYADEDALLDAGVVALLRELLDAGWELRKEWEEPLAPFMVERLEQPAGFADGGTLEEALCLAFLVHRGAS